MKIWLTALCLLLLVGVSGCATRLDAEGEAAYSALKSVSSFDAGGFIFGVTDDEASLRVLLKQKQAVDVFQSLLKEATPAGQMYALVGLKSADPIAFDKAVTPFLTLKTKVRVMYGSIEAEDTVATVADDIRKGNIALSAQRK